METWLRAEHGAAFVTRRADLLPKVASLRRTSSDFHELFRRYAEPAFRSFLP
jgi:hypothetical protein